MKRDDEIMLTLKAEETYFILTLVNAPNYKLKELLKSTYKNDITVDYETIFEKPNATYVLYKKLLEALDAELLSHISFEGTPEELTLEEVCEELGREVKIIK